MVTNQCKKQKSGASCNHSSCEMPQSDVMSDSLFTFLNNLSKRMLSLHKKVVLTMKQYKIKDIHPYHPDKENDPTHILIFCLRWLRTKKFQPIGGILFKPEEYTGVVTDLGKTLGEFIKAYLWSIKKMDLVVVALVSPPDDYFKIIIRYLTQSNDFETGEAPITFYSEQFKDVACIYDPAVIQSNFEAIFKSNDISFSQNNQYLYASWNHINSLMKLSEFEDFRSYLLADKDRTVFIERIQNSLFKYSRDGTLNNEVHGTAVLIHTIRCFTQFLEQEGTTFKKLDEMFALWEHAIDVLEQLKFKPIIFANPDYESMLDVLASLVLKSDYNFDDSSSSRESFSEVESFAGKEVPLRLASKGKENKCKKPYSRPRKVCQWLKKMTIDIDEMQKSHDGKPYSDSERESADGAGTSLLANTMKTYNTMSQETERKFLRPQKARNKNIPYSRPVRVRKNRQHEPLLKQVDADNCVLPTSFSGEDTDTDSVLGAVTKDTMEKVLHWSDSDDAFLDDGDDISKTSSKSPVDNPRRISKPYSRVDPLDIKIAKCIYDTIDLPPNSINASLKECTELINQMKHTCKKTIRNKEESPTRPEKPPTTTDEKFEPHICAFEYTSCIRSMRFAVNKLVHYNMDYFQIDAFKCDHIDYFVNLIKKEINKLDVPAHTIKNPDCTLHHQNQAYSVLEKNSGNLFCLKQQT